MTKEKIIKILCHILIVALFVYLIDNTDFDDMFIELRRTEPFILISVVLLQFITQLLLIIQWHRITKNVIGQSIISKMVYIFTKGSLIEAITPGAKIGGEASRLYYLKKEYACETNEAVNIILMQKSISMSVLMLVCVICLLDISNHMKRFLPLPVQFIISAVFLGLVMAMIGSLFFSRRLIRFLENPKSNFSKKIKKYMQSYSNAVSKLGKKEWIIQFSISMAVWLLFPVKMFILAQSFGIRLDFEHTTAVTMTSYMMGMLPITPGGLGTFEGTMLALLSLFSVKKSAGIAVTLIFRFITFWLVIIASVVYSGIYDILKRGGKIVKR